MTKDIISEASKRLFFERGTKAVNMNDIASTLGISKKTIYNFFESKDEIVQYEIEKHMLQQTCSVNEIKQSAFNAIDELRQIYLINLKQHNEMKPIFITDIQRYYVDLWGRLQNFLSSKIFQNISENIQRGQKESLYRKEIKIDFIAMQYYHSVINLINYFSNQKKYSLTDLEKELMYYHIRAIGTPKGIQYLETIKFEN